MALAKLNDERTRNSGLSRRTCSDTVARGMTKAGGKVRVSRGKPLLRPRGSALPFAHPLVRLAGSSSLAARGRTLKSTFFFLPVMAASFSTSPAIEREHFPNKDQRGVISPRQVTAKPALDREGPKQLNGPTPHWGCPGIHHVGR